MQSGHEVNRDFTKSYKAENIKCFIHSNKKVSENKSARNIYQLPKERNEIKVVKHLQAVKLLVDKWINTENCKNSVPVSLRVSILPYIVSFGAALIFAD